MSADRASRAALEQAQARLKTLKADLASTERPEFEAQKQAVSEACVTARAEVSYATPLWEQAKKGADATAAELHGLQVHKQAALAQRSVGAIAHLLWPVMLVGYIILMVRVIDARPPELLVEGCGLGVAFLLGFVWQRRLKPGGKTIPQAVPTESLLPKEEPTLAKVKPQVTQR